jgi:hypothetical protein
MTPEESAPSIGLPKALAIGFTGHRALDDETECRMSIADFLQQKKRSGAGVVYGVCSAAAGGDLVFAEACLELGIPLRVLLPFAAEEFRKDFAQSDWSRVERVLTQAVSVEVVSSSQSRNECYYECGIETVLQARILLALWNGEPSQGLGGTGDIVSFAKGLGKPVVWLNSTTGEVQTFNEYSSGHLAGDSELDFLNQLPEAGPFLAKEGCENLARAWFSKVDDNATQISPRVRRLATIPIVCTAGAALFSGAGSWAGQPAPWLTTGTVLGIMAAALPALLRLRSRQVLWVRMRTAAEVCRSFLAFWATPGPYDAVGPEVIPELSGVLASLNLLKMLGRGQAVSSLEEFKRQYRGDRVRGQISYFFAHAAQSDAESRRYRALIWTSIALAVLANVWLFVGVHFHTTGTHYKQWLGLGASIAFQIATVAAALLAVNDCERRRQRYRELHRDLSSWDVELETLQTWRSALRVAARIERALLAELIEWRSTIGNRKLSGKR